MDTRHDLPELLAPAGRWDCRRAAVANGADAIFDDGYLKGTMWLVNPAIILKNWNQFEVGISLELNGTGLASCVDFRSR